MADVTIDIDDLRLVGLGPFRAGALTEAVERELARLVDEEGPAALDHATVARAIQRGLAGGGER
jgi:hypothetical protein